METIFSSGSISQFRNWSVVPVILYFMDGDSFLKV
jgi:hypothetical protein